MNVKPVVYLCCGLLLGGCDRAEKGASTTVAIDGELGDDITSFRSEMNAALLNYESALEKGTKKDAAIARERIMILQSKGLVIYGPDDRKNYYEATDQQREAADATAVLLWKADLSAVDGGASYSIPQGTANLCASERFDEEPAPGHCSGFKVGKNRFATAGHCVSSQEECDSLVFVRGFHIAKEDGSAPASVDASHVYSCRRLVDRRLDDRTGSDWAIVEADREIGGPAVEVRRVGAATIKPKTKLVVVGYPMGLPSKVSDNAIVRRVKGAYLVANLDTYGGNSGSAVFNSDELSKGRLLVEGILVRGEDDFAQTEPCKISKKCANDQCRGEDVTLSKEFEAAIVME